MFVSFLPYAAAFLSQQLRSVTFLRRAAVALCAVFALFLSFGFLPAAQAQDPCTPVHSWSDLYTAMQDNGCIELKNDVTYGTGGGSFESENLVVQSQYVVTLDLKTFTIDRGLKDKDAVQHGFVIQVQGELTLTGSGKITGGNNTYEGGGILNRGTLTIAADSTIYITDNTAKARGGGVYNERNSTFNMYSGTISGNTAGLGGGVHNKGIFNMTGGTIYGNSAGSSAGVNTEDGTFNLSGGEITGNKAIGQGSVRCGGVLYLMTPDLNISGNPVISGNTVNGKPSNVCNLISSHPPFTVSGTLTGSASSIGITMAYPDVFTSGLQGKGDASIFFSDDEDYYVAAGNRDGEAKLINRTLAFEGTKTLTGRDLTEDDIFKFAVREGDTTVSTGQNDTSGKIIFTPIRYPVDGLGIHNYTVTETSKDGNGIVVDRTAQTVTVTVDKDADGFLKIVPSENYKSLNFVNSIATVELTLTAPEFDEVNYGYEQPAAQALTIKNTGNSKATISSVRLSGGDSSAFTIDSSSASAAVPAGGTNETYTIRPKAGLDAKTYTDTITVTYDNDDAAAAEIRFTVNPKSVTVTGVKAADRTFEPGNLSVELYGGEVAGKVESDDVSVDLSAAAGTIAAADAGTDKAVTVTGVSLTGGKAGNYMLSAQPAAVTVTIAKAPITPEVEMNGYTYGDDPIPAPKLAEGGNPGGGTVTYYYSTSDSAGSGTKWENITGTTLAANTYYMYAEVSETDNYSEAVSAAKAFTVGQTGEAVVTITGHQNTVSYDGQEHSVSGYDVQINNTKYSEADFSFIGTAEAKQTVAGTAVMGLTADMFTNLNGNFSKVTFNVTDGFQTVTQKPVTVTAENQSKLEGEADPDLTAVVGGTIGDDTVTYSLAREGDDSVGSHAIKVTGEASQGNYAVTFVDGTLTITAKDTAPVTTAPEAAAGLTADGSAHALLKTAGASVGGTFYYRVDDGGEWSPDVPTASAAGTYEIWYYIQGTDGYKDNGSRSAPLGPLTVTIAKESMELPVEISVVQGNGDKGVPVDVKAQTIRLTIRLKQNGGQIIVSAPIELAVTPGGNRTPAEISAIFTPNVTDFNETCGNYEYEVLVTPGEVKADIAGAGDNGPAYLLKAAVGSPDCEKFVVTLYWNSKAAAPAPEVIRVVALPEDEIGAYKLRDDGTKEYLLFQTYDICMAWLGSDELCRGPERCYHK